MKLWVLVGLHAKFFYIIRVYIYIYIYIYVHTYVFAVVKWADGFSGVPRISPVLGRTVSGSTFLFLDLFLLLVEVAGSKVLRLAAGRNLEKDD